MLRRGPQLLRFFPEIHRRINFFHNISLMSKLSSPSPSACMPHPKPISDLPPPTARIAEQNRAAAAELAAQNGPVLDSNSILYQDEWLLVLHKPARVYCEHLLKSVPMLLGSGPYVPQPSVHRAQPQASLSSSAPLPVALAAVNDSVSQHVKQSEGRIELETPPDLTSPSMDNNADSGGQSAAKARKPRPPSQTYFLANRLDRDTSGVIVVAKHKEVAGKLGKLFSERGVNKSYIALCYGSLPPSDSQSTEYEVSSGHGRSRHGLWRVYDSEDIGRELPGGSVVKHMHTKFAVLGEATEVLCAEAQHGTSVPHKLSYTQPDPHTRVMDEDSIDAEAAGVVNDRDPFRTQLVELSIGEARSSHAQQNLRPSTNPEQLMLNPEATGGAAAADLPGNAPRFYLMRAHPTTGRTHQIRLHAQHLHLPLAGDVRYGGPERWTHEGLQYDCHALHAESIRFRHPYSGKEVVVVSPLPAWANARRQ